MRRYYEIQATHARSQAKRNRFLAAGYFVAAGINLALIMPYWGGPLVWVWPVLAVAWTVCAVSLHLSARAGHEAARTFDALAEGAWWKDTSDD